MISTNIFYIIKDIRTVYYNSKNFIYKFAPKKKLLKNNKVFNKTLWRMPLFKVLAFKILNVI